MLYNMPRRFLAQILLDAESFLMLMSHTNIWGRPNLYSYDLLLAWPLYNTCEIMLLVFSHFSG